MKVMIAISHSGVAPRFDLAMEAVIAESRNGTIAHEPRVLLISEHSGDELCALAVGEAADIVVCGGIDQVHYDYLVWKKISVIENVIGPYDEALKRLLKGKLTPGTILPGAVAK